MNWKKAVGAGIIGALAMTVLLLLSRAAGATEMNAEMGLGSMITGTMSIPTWYLGLGIHLMFGAGFGLAYGMFMEVLGRRGVGPGLAISVAHIVFSGLMMPVVMGMHPMIRSGEMPEPGMFASNMGAVTVVLFVVEHLLFGSIVGGIYQLRRVPLVIIIDEAPARRRPPTKLVPG